MSVKFVETSFGELAHVNGVHVAELPQDAKLRKVHNALHGLRGGLDSDGAFRDDNTDYSNTGRKYLPEIPLRKLRYNSMLDFLERRRRLALHVALEAEISVAKRLVMAKEAAIEVETVLDDLGGSKKVPILVRKRVMKKGGKKKAKC